MSSDIIDQANELVEHRLQLAIKNTVLIAMQSPQSTALNAERTFLRHAGLQCLAAKCAPVARKF